MFAVCTKIISKLAPVIWAGKVLEDGLVSFNNGVKKLRDMFAAQKHCVLTIQTDAFL